MVTAAGSPAAGFERLRFLARKRTADRLATVRRRIRGLGRCQKTRRRMRKRFVLKRVGISDVVTGGVRRPLLFVVRRRRIEVLGVGLRAVARVNR